MQGISNILSFKTRHCGISDVVQKIVKFVCCAIHSNVPNTIMKIAVLEVHGYHKEVLPMWVEAFNAFEDSEVTFYLNNNGDYGTTEYMSSLPGKRRFKQCNALWKDMEKSITHVVVNTFPFDNERITTKFLDAVAASRCIALLYVHRPEKLMGRNAAILRRLALSKQNNLVFACPRGEQWTIAKQPTLMESISHSWMIPVHCAPKDSKIVRNQYQLAVIGNLEPARRDYTRMLNALNVAAKETQPLEMCICGRKTNFYPKLLAEIKSRSLNHLIQVNTNISQKSVVNKVYAAGFVVAAATTGHRYMSNALTGSIPIALNTGTPLFIDSDLLQCYRDVLNEQCGVVVSKFTNDAFVPLSLITTEEYHGMENAVVNARKQMIDRNKQTVVKLLGIDDTQTV